MRYHHLNPLALALATGAAASGLSLFIGIPMMGFGGMLGREGGYAGSGWMMGGYGLGAGVGFGLGVAWVSNAVCAAHQRASTGSGNEGGANLRSSH